MEGIEELIPTNFKLVRPAVTTSQPGALDVSHYEHISYRRLIADNCKLARHLVRISQPGALTC